MSVNESIFYSFFRRRDPKDDVCGGCSLKSHCSCEFTPKFSCLYKWLLLLDDNLKLAIVEGAYRKDDKVTFGTITSICKSVNDNTDCLDDYGMNPMTMDTPNAVVDVIQEYFRSRIT